MSVAFLRCWSETDKKFFYTAENCSVLKIPECLRKTTKAVDEDQTKLGVYMDFDTGEGEQFRERCWSNTHNNWLVYVPEDLCNREYHNCCGDACDLRPQAVVLQFNVSSNCGNRDSSWPHIPCNTLLSSKTFLIGLSADSQGCAYRHTEGSPLSQPTDFLYVNVAVYHNKFGSGDIEVAISAGGDTIGFCFNHSSIIHTGSDCVNCGGSSHPSLENQYVCGSDGIYDDYRFHSDNGNVNLYFGW
jgi:hypothetical protein